MNVDYSKGDVSSLISALHELALDQLDSAAFAVYVRLIATWHEDHLKGRRAMTQALIRLTANETTLENVRDAVYGFDDSLDLALSGHYGTVEDVEQSVREFMREYVV
ncbi:hypothetical protein [Deinococcus alpinitundrae]|uniref:hypothetical protein n=1 Tax=Deinococcus alpinitundrae TaxID=468913 RepID=UPI0013798496|nr:hypothetical protein [Deinococcus alpinitundrae]